MEQLGQQTQQVYEYSKEEDLAGCGTQTAGLAFGGYVLQLL
jgi:hypothetical protein